VSPIADLQSKKYLTVSEVAEYFQLSTETVYLYARTGVLPATRIGKHWRFSIDRLNEWADKQAEVDAVSAHALILDSDAEAISSLQKWINEVKGSAVVGLERSQVEDLLVMKSYDVIFFDPTSDLFDGLHTFKRLVELRNSAELVLMAKEFDAHMMTEALSIAPLTVLSKPTNRPAFDRVIESLRAR
jgi:excisionase family DNA binding protein